jgi:hypothetical protein
MKTCRDNLARTSPGHPPPPSPRRGSMLTIVMVLLVVISLLTAALVRGSLLGVRRQQLAERVAQADLLLQAGRDRAVALWRGAGPAAFPEGQAGWELSADEVPGGARVELRLTEGLAGSPPQVDVTVTCPREGPTPIRRAGRFALPTRMSVPPATPPAPPAAAANNSDAN